MGYSGEILLEFRYIILFNYYMYNKIISNLIDIFLVIHIYGNLFIANNNYVLK